MMRSILLCGLLAFSIAHAEVLPENVIQQVATKVQASCMKSELKDKSYHSDLEELCQCTQSSMAASLRTTQFSSISKPTQADLDLIGAAETKVTQACGRTQQEKMVITAGIPKCIAGAKSNPKLKSLSRENQEALCTCAAKRTAHYMDFEKVGKMDKYNRQAWINASWAVSIDECIKK